ncbi:MAG: hypothetical protein M1548_07205 [Actinobacteria bacterium]|nr:hypothetical protein [Chloroflexota bacterium]MCL5292299.1 hypothetical protein [Actinomycetota bacterium]
MVTRINLLPPEIRQRDRKDRIIVYMFLSLIVLAFVMFGVKLLRDYQINEAKAKLDEVRAESSSVNQRIVQLKAYEDREKELVRLNGVLSTAMAEAMTWSKVLNDISIITPNDVVIKQMSGNKDGMNFKAEVTIAANNAAGHKPVAKWLINLRRVPSFGYVWLGSSTKAGNTLGADATVKFQAQQAKEQAPKVPPVKGK